MANEILIASSLTPINDAGTAGDYTNRKIDANALRSFGGKYNTLTAYTDAGIARWSGVVVVSTITYDGFNDSGWTEAAAVTDGAIPTNVFAVAIEFIGKIGATNYIYLALYKTGEEIVMAKLALGEGISIPIQERLAITDVRIKAEAYSNGVNEATVNVLILGT